MRLRWLLLPNFLPKSFNSLNIKEIMDTTISPWLVYLVMQADNILGLFIGLTALSSFFAVALLSVWLVMAIHEEKVPEDMKKWAIRCTFISCFLAILVTLIPKTKTLAAIIIIPKIANSEAIQKDLPDLYKLGVEKLKESLGQEKKN